MLQHLRNWQTWALMVFVAFAVSISVRVSFEVFSGHRQQTDKMMKEHSDIVARIERLEMSKSPATMKRYTSDDAARDKLELMLEIDKRCSK